MEIAAAGFEQAESVGQGGIFTHQFRQMIAVVGDVSNTASIALHERLGFRTVGVFSGLGRKHGRWLDTVQMQLDLGAGRTTAPETD